MFLTTPLSDNQTTSFDYFWQSMLPCSILIKMISQDVIYTLSDLGQGCPKQKSPRSSRIVFSVLDESSDFEEPLLGV